MPRVKTLRPHRNIHGQHKEGDEYQHTRPATDIKFRYVEEVPPTVVELKKTAEAQNIELPKKGSGKKGAVLKADIAKAVEDAG